MMNISKVSLDKRKDIRLEIANLYFENRLNNNKLKHTNDSLEKEVLTYKRDNLHHKIRVMKSKHNELVKMYKKSRNDRGGVLLFINEEKAGEQLW